MKVLVSVMSGLVWGSGQLINKQKIKSLIYFVAWFAFISLELFTGTLNIWLGNAEAHFRNAGFFSRGIWGLITLGEIPRTDSSVLIYDHSTMLMLQGLMALIVILGFIIVTITCVLDAYRTRCAIEKGEGLSSVQSLKNSYTKYFEYIAITPGLVLVMFISILPVLFSMLISLTNYNTNNIPPKFLVNWIGFSNFADIVRLPVWGRTFVGVFIWTVIWAFLAATTSYFGGLFQAVMINSKHVRHKKLWRGFFMLPWAIPGFVSLLVFKNIFHGNGPINRYLTNLGLIEKNIPFLSDPTWAKVVLVLVNLWLGFPYFMALISGVMASVNQEMYEAAEIDGANAFHIFRKLTLPVILAATAPQFIFSVTHNFNNFGTVFYLTGGAPANPNYTVAGSTDILITWIYKLTIDQRMYNYASVMSILIFVILGTVGGINLARTRAFREE